MKWTYSSSPPGSVSHRARPSSLLRPGFVDPPIYIELAIAFFEAQVGGGGDKVPPHLNGDGVLCCPSPADIIDIFRQRVVRVAAVCVHLLSLFALNHQQKTAIRTFFGIKSYIKSAGRAFPLGSKLLRLLYFGMYFLGVFINAFCGRLSIFF